MLTGQIGVYNPEKNYRFSNIESTSTYKHHMQGLSSIRPHVTSYIVHPNITINGHLMILAGLLFFWRYHHYNVCN